MSSCDGFYGRQGNQKSQISIVMAFMVDKGSENMISSVMTFMADKGTRNKTSTPMQSF